MMVGKYLLFSSLFLFINQFHRTHSVCSIDSNGNQRVGSRCEYACHCKSTKEMCDDVTGHCVSGCATGWTGPGCQYEDIAFNKYRRHIDNIPDKQMWADYANDGNVSSCSRTGDPRTQKNLRRSGKPWWWVQLDTAVNMKLIQGLVITTESGQESLFSGFKVYVEESRSELKNTYEKQQTCFSHNGTFLNTTMHVTCNKPLIGNRVRIELDSGNSQLVLCDVKVFEGRNLAYGRVAALSSEDDISANALFAVDGKVSTSACSKTKKELFPWWSVDLNKTFAIHSIRITKYNDGWYTAVVITILQKNFIGSNMDDSNTTYNSNNFSATLSHYKLQTINAWSNAWTTLYDDGEMDTPTTYLVLSATVRHLRLYWEGSWKMFQVAVCEFQAFGDCPEHKCGLDCTTDCHCQDFSLADRFTETCTNGCENRWTGINGKCNIECAAGKWGPSCDNPCGYCINREQCEAQTGYCLNGCEDGYMTDEFCVLPCDDRNYGPGCTYNCSGHCKNGDLCQKSNGNCPYGCDIGWEGDLCDEMCQEGYYGDNCSSECGQCLHGTCDRIYGGCTGGCKDGYIYDMYCDKACVNATWGSNCSEQCGQCLDGPCDNIDGVCSQGCLPGYINTEYCNEQCRHGTYGHNCAEKCSVTCYHPSVCRPNDGQCELCMTGWKGYTCEQECEEHEWCEGCIYRCGGCTMYK